MGRFSARVQLEALHTDSPAVSGLTMVGQDIFSVGVIGALVSGAITAALLSPMAFIRLIAEAILG